MYFDNSEYYSQESSTGNYAHIIDNNGEERLARVAGHESYTSGVYINGIPVLTTNAGVKVFSVQGYEATNLGDGAIILTNGESTFLPN